ncbi:hypothetical protein OG689_35600 [Kitasatospora sp. NBC_00240]|uniref:ATP-grasp domain-containing protein n=1 Tax=Kitasatospora sp. NBC_00240 TaxID=2903567 RepID=UPI00225BFBE8|nr:hypothetical protein [Kitasatospora sp. NBC_00240]MCX5214526.1 hypothetical protein [Kitasatospora sp. NBC_00240]
MRTLIINRHDLTWATGHRGSHLPTAPENRFLLTRTFGGGLAGYDATAFPHLTVVDSYFADRLEAAARWLVETHRIRQVVALHEKDLLLAAVLRESHGLAGTDVATTLRFRDKIVMKDALRGAGYSGLPQYRALGPGEELTAVPWKGRTVVKSRWGLGSEQVRIADDLAAANAAARELEARGEQVEAEEFVTGAMYHCDSVVVDGRIVFTAVSRYLSAPGEFRPGGVCGSVVLTGGAVHEALRAENAQVLAVLAPGSAVTHVEFFRRPGGELVFCEAAARPGGGGIRDLLLSAYGIDIVRAAVEIQSGTAPSLPAVIAPPSRATGLIGIYHCATGEDRPAEGLQECVPGLSSYHFSPRRSPGRVRHSADYAHLAVLTADTEEELDRRFALVVDAVRAGGAPRPNAPEGDHAVPNR